MQERNRPWLWLSPTEGEVGADGGARRAVVDAVPSAGGGSDETLVALNRNDSGVA
jgi:hypothetical protein